MKKLVSLLVVLAMLLTMAPAVFAEEADDGLQTLVLGENTAVYDADTETPAYFMWEATANGNLTLAFDEEGRSPYVYVAEGTVYNTIWQSDVNDPEFNITVAVEEGSVYIITVEDYEMENATLYFTATFTPAAGSGLEGAGTEADPWVLTELNTIEGNFASGAEEHYYMYEVAESGTYTLDSFKDCSIMVFIDEIVWGGGQVSDPSLGFYVEANQVIYVAIFWDYNHTEYSVEFTFTTGEGGEVVTDPVGSRTNPATLPLGQEVSLSTDSMNGYFYTWTADEETLLVLRMSTDYTNWNYVVMVERDGEEAYSNENSGNGDVIYATEVVYVMEGDVVSLWVGTIEGSDYVYFQADTCIGSEEIPVEPYFVPSVSRSQMIANVILPDVDLYISPYYYSYYGPMNVSVTDPSGNTTDLGLRSGEPFKTSVGGKYTITCTYREGSSDNPFKVVENGTYTANIVNNKPYYFSFNATVAGTLTVTVGDANTEAWYYYINGSVGYYDSNSAVESPVNPITLQVREGDKFTMQVKISGDYQNTDSAEIPVTFTFVPAETEETVTGELVLGTNELEVVGGDDEYGLSLYTYTNNSTETKTVYFTVRAWYSSGYDGVESGYLLRSTDTRIRIDGEFLTESFKVSKELAPGESVEVKLIALDKYAYYATLEVSEEGFYTATAGDREKPLTLEFPEEDSAIFTPAGSDDWYVLAYDVFSAGGNLVFTGENIVIKTICYDNAADAFVTKTFTAVDGVVTVPVTEDMCWGNELLQICNVGTADVDVPYAVDYPVGHRLNPEELPINKTFDVELEEDNTGYYYTWTATEAGKLTITVNGEYWGYTLNNNEYYATYGDSNVASLIVSEGSVVNFYVETFHEEDNKFTTPASTLTITTLFEAGEVTCDHTSTYFEVAWLDENYEEYNVLEVCTACGETCDLYKGVWFSNNADYTGYELVIELPAGANKLAAFNLNGMIIDVVDAEGNVVETVTTESCGDYGYPSIFTVTVETAGTYTLVASYPMGSQGNPAQLVIGENKASLEAGNYEGYYYTWIAPKDGTLTLSATVTGGVAFDFSAYNFDTYKKLYMSEEGVDGVLTIEVSAGTELQICIWAADAVACDFNLVASFEEAATTLMGDLNGDGKVNTADLNLLYRYVMQDETLTWTDTYAQVSDLNGDGKVNTADLNLLYRYVMQDETLTWSPYAE